MSSNYNLQPNPNNNQAPKNHQSGRSNQQSKMSSRLNTSTNSKSQWTGEQNKCLCNRSEFKKSFSSCRDTHLIMHLLDVRGADCLTVFLNLIRLILRFWNLSLRIGRQRLSFSTLATWNLRKSATVSGSTNGMRSRICSCRSKSLIILTYTMLLSTHVNLLVSRWLRAPQMTCSIFSGRVTLCQMTLRTSISIRSQTTFLARRSLAAKTYCGVTWIDWGSSSPRSFQLHPWVMSWQKSTGSFRRIVLTLRTKKLFTFWNPWQQAVGVASKSLTVSNMSATKKEC